jgi:hypothetical protein
MKDCISPQLGSSEISKWSVIQYIMREKNISILYVQETHLLPKHEAQIDTLYSQQLKVINSRDLHRPGNSTGIAIVINKKIFNPEDLTTTKIIPGRVLALQTKWHNDMYIIIMNIYTPNTHSQYAEFWNTIART